MPLTYAHCLNIPQTSPLAGSAPRLVRPASPRCLRILHGAAKIAGGRQGMKEVCRAELTNDVTDLATLLDPYSPPASPRGPSTPQTQTSKAAEQSRLLLKALSYRLHKRLKCRCKGALSPSNHFEHWIGHHSAIDDQAANASLEEQDGVFWRNL
ncbi:hypothetical protein B0H17DRAFT_1144544 [Mycena rosella]|uniref:Uncharacterized protein n=1 Tax=Mycena rosella TaxID=1033263 RepID=A0AAD7G2S2_MYCRO|nr:hypothetical protein B0H17DRAFT_1144544 [Mycena rosella]